MRVYNGVLWTFAKGKTAGKETIVVINSLKMFVKTKSYS